MEQMIEHWPHFLQQHFFSITKAILLSAMGVVLVTRSRRFFHNHLMKQLKDPTLGIFAINAISALIILVISIIVLEQLGIPTSSLITLLAASSLAIGLSLRSSLSNIAGGLMLLILRPFKIGDYIEISGNAAGYVTQINLFNTLLKTPDNQIVHLPNLKLIDTVITNYNQTETRRIQLTLNLTYETKVKSIKKIIAEIFQHHPHILRHPEPNLTVVNLNDNGIVLAIQVWVKLEDYAKTKATLYEEILEVFAQDNLPIATKTIKTSLSYAETPS